MLPNTSKRSNTFFLLNLLISNIKIDFNNKKKTVLEKSDTKTSNKKTFVCSFMADQKGAHTMNERESFQRFLFLTMVSDIVVSFSNGKNAFVSDS